MHDDFDARMGMPPTAQNYSLKHPPFELQDRYVLAPHTLTRREKIVIFRHLRSCSFCRRMQGAMRAKPDEMLQVWHSPDPR